MTIRSVQMLMGRIQVLEVTAKVGGELVMAGAWADPIDGAALIFKVDDPSVIERFVASDPYVTNGLVAQWRIRKWEVVIGGEADS